MRRAALVVTVGPLDVTQRQCFASLGHGLGDKGEVRVGEIGIGPGSCEVFRAGAVTLGFDIDRRVVQQQDAGIAVLGGDFPLRVKLFENRRHVAGGAVLRNGFGVVLGIDTDLVLHGEVQ